MYDAVQKYKGLEVLQIDLIVDIRRLFQLQKL